MNLKYLSTTTEERNRDIFIVIRRACVCMAGEVEKREGKDSPTRRSLLAIASKISEYYDK